MSAGFKTAHAEAIARRLGCTYSEACRRLGRAGNRRRVLNLRRVQATSDSAIRAKRWDLREDSL
jgi:hypothetical protein